MGHTAPFEVYVDKEVYLQPTGNAARWWNGNPKVGQVISVKRKYFYVVIDRGSNYQSYPIKFSLENFTNVDSDLNSGYLAYPTLKAFCEAQEKEQMCKELCRAWDICGGYRRLSFNTVKQIYEIMVAEGVILREDGEND